MSDATFLARGQRAMQQSDVQGGKIIFSPGQNLPLLTQPCTVGAFARLDDYSNGVSPHLTGDAQILISDLPPNFEFNLGDFVTVLPNSGNPRKCKIHSSHYDGPRVNLVLWDLNEGA